MAAISLVSASPALAQRHELDPADYGTLAQVQELARVTCTDDGYQALGYPTYTACYNDIVNIWKPAGSGGDGGAWAFCHSFAALTGIACFA